MTGAGWLSLSLEQSRLQGQGVDAAHRVDLILGVEAQPLLGIAEPRQGKDFEIGQALVAKALGALDLVIGAEQVPARQRRTDGLRAPRVRAHPAASSRCSALR